MNERFQSWLPTATVLLLAVLSGVGWRAELELRSGWHGLVWLTYFHWAVPFSIAGFVAWAACFAPVRRRFFFTALLAAAAVIGHFIAGLALWLFFISGPSAGIFAATLGAGDFDRGIHRLELLRCAATFAWPLIPLAFCLLCRAFGAPISRGRAICSALLFTASWLFAVLVRAGFESHGASDLIHTLKSGFVIPFLIASLGLPLLHISWSFVHASPRTEAA